MHFFTALLSVLAVSTTATPFHLAYSSTGKLLDAVPVPITQPGGGETYYVGSRQSCCWSTDNIPSSASSKMGSLLLGHYDAGSNYQHIDHKNPLVSGFYLTKGCAIYVVPDVHAGDSYFIVMDGGSGSTSATFTIQPGS